MKITFLGHASLSIEIKDFVILVDPFITGNPKAEGIDVNTLKADYILVTHAHQDHILDVEAIAKRTEATIISNYEIVNYYQAKGLEGHPMNHGGNWDFEFGKLKYVNAIHSSSFPDGKYGGQPGGFVIEAALIGRNAIALDLEQEMVNGAMKNVLWALGSEEITTAEHIQIIRGDATDLANSIPRKWHQKISGLVLDPPYGRNSHGSLSHFDLIRNIKQFRIFKFLRIGATACMGSNSL